MGKIDKSNGQDATMERRHIKAMLRNVEQYEQVKKNEHPEYNTAQAFYDGQGICKQNFLKYYRRYLLGHRDTNVLIPQKTGRKFKDAINYEPEVVEKVEEIRSKGYNKFDIATLINRDNNEVVISASSVYRLMRKLGINKLNPRIKEEKRKLIKMKAGEMGHIDIHYISKGTVKETGSKKLYLLGIIDNYSRLCWLEVIDSIKAIDVMFGSLDVLMRLKERYDIKFEEILSDNGSKFSSRNNAQHPMERMLKFYDIKHRYTKAFCPQTNGKIERFWRTIEDELLGGEEFETLAELKNYILGYVIYYNEHRNHQGINTIPIKMINKQV